MAIFFIERAILIFANSIIEPFFGRIEQKLALSGSFYQRHPVDYKIFIFLGQPLVIKNSDYTGHMTLEKFNYEYPEIARDVGCDAWKERTRGIEPVKANRVKPKGIGK